MSAGDIVASPGGELYRVLWTNSGAVHVKNLETDQTTSFLEDDLTVIERHPGGQGAAK